MSVFLTVNSSHPHYLMTSIEFMANEIPSMNEYDDILRKDKERCIEALLREPSSPNTLQRHVQEYEQMVAQASHDMTAYDVQIALEKQRVFRDRLAEMARSQTKAQFCFSKKKTEAPPVVPLPARKNGADENTNNFINDRKDEDVMCDLSTAATTSSSSSVMFRNIVNCRVHLKGYEQQQIRIHNSCDTLFRITYCDEKKEERESYTPREKQDREKVAHTSKIIIEDCKNLEFMFVGGTPVDIQDFGWLKSTPSPNFSIIHSIT